VGCEENHKGELPLWFSLWFSLGIFSFTGANLHLTFTPEGVEFAYRLGLFPMYDSRSGEILWYRPDPRAIIPLDGFHVSHSLAKRMRRTDYGIRFNTDFVGVMRGCADRYDGTWISEEFIEVYSALHSMGVAHCVETWMDGKLVGGAYGIAIGGAFMAESMFHYRTDASKLALAALVDRLRTRGFTLLDTQYLTSHLESLGAVEIPHRVYYEHLRRALRQNCSFV
jgi:leucyl/phenylalanyl-tRNA--protein transferase